MSKRQIKTAEVVGSANLKFWSQVQVGRRNGKNIWVLVSLSYGGEGDLIDLAQIGTSFLEALGERGRVVNEDIKSLGAEVGVTAAVMVESEGQMMVSGVGELEMFLLRGNRLGKVFVGGSELAEIGGPLILGDRLIILTKALSKLLGVGGISKYLKEGLTGVESMMVLVHGSGDSSQMAAIMGEVEEENEEVAAVPQYKKVLAMGGLRDRLFTTLGRLSFRKPLMIKEEKKRWNMAIGLVLMGLLVIGVLGGMVRRSRLVKDRAYNQLESSLAQKMQEAKSIADLNPERAKLLLSQGKSEIEQYLTENKDQKYRIKANNLSEEMKKIETEIFKKQEVTLNTLIELSLLKNGLASEKMFLGAEGNILLPDSDSAQIAGINLKDKSTLGIDLGDLGAAKELSVYNKKTYGIVDKGVFVISGSENKIVIEPDELWKEVTLIDVFGGNVYLLDRGQSEVWKYPVLTDGFGTRRRWLGAGIQLDLSNVIDMKVDGEIWLLTSTGKLERYSRGVPVEFSMEGFPYIEGDKLASPTALFVTDEKVYVLETGAKRVVVFNKESGKYERQYAAEELKDGRDLVIYQDKAYVLLPDKIVWFQL